MPLTGAQIGAQIGASGGPDTKTPVDWGGNEVSPPQAKPGTWPTDVSLYDPTAGQGQRPAQAGPSITFVSVTGITATGAVLTFTVDKASTGMLALYGVTTAYGGSQAAVPPSGGPGTITVTLTGLTTATLYHFRFQATANGQTTLGTDRTFTTS